MSLGSRTFRVFVSSTFADLKAERDALQKNVFPRLSELAESHGCHFQAIDLRWGISEEAGLDHQTMKICLGEVERCQRVSPRPNFIILLGDRYGWMPLPYAILADEMGLILGHLTQAERQLVFWEEVPQESAGSAQAMVAWMDGAPQGDKGWYRLDTNAVPPAYILQPRLKGSPFEDHRYWVAQVEGPLHEILLRATVESRLTDRQMLKYSTSATHQEILEGALQVTDAPEHVFGFFRSITNLDDLVASQDQGASKAGDYCDYDGAVFNKQAYLEAQRLKNNLESYLPENITRYQAQWDGTNISQKHIGHLPSTLKDCMALLKAADDGHILCQAVWRRLAGVILDEIASYKQQDALELEMAAHAQFGQQRRQGFLGRDDALRAISTYVSGDRPHPFVINGKPGSGKTALMAQASTLAAAYIPNAKIVTRFIGATPGSSECRALLTGLMQEIDKLYHHDGNKPSGDLKRLIREFQFQLRSANSKEPLVIFLDALDRLSEDDAGWNLDWLPVTLPKHVHIIVSLTEGSILNVLQNRMQQAFRNNKAFEAKLIEQYFFPLQAMDTRDGARILKQWLAAVGRTLTETQQSNILDKFQDAQGLPFYLRLAFDEARAWRSYDRRVGLPDFESDGAGAIQSLLSHFFTRLAQPQNHGKIFVSKVMGLLVAARHGLSESELLKALWKDENIRQDFFHRSHANVQVDIDRLPLVIWSRLYFDLSHLLTDQQANGTTVLNFYHNQAEEVARDTYCSGQEKIDHHRSLAALFSAADNWQDPLHHYPNARKTAELPYQQTLGDLSADLAATLTDFDFLEAKCFTDNEPDLEQDYRRALEHWPGESEARNILSAFLLCLGQESHNIQKSPELLVPHLFNRLAWLSPQQEVIQSLLAATHAKSHRNWLRALQHPEKNRLLDGIDEEFLGNKEIPCGVVFVTRSTDGLLLAGTQDRVIEAWDDHGGEPVYSLKGFLQHADSLALTDDGKAISGAEDHTVKVWDVESGSLIRTLEGHTKEINTLALSKNGKIVSGSSDKTIKIWSLDTGRLLHTLEGHKKEVRALVISANKRVISWSKDQQMMVWDLETGQFLRKLQGDTGDISVLLPIPDGRVIGGTDHGQISIWNLETGRLEASWQGHKDKIYRIRLTPRGNLATCSRDKTICTWDLAQNHLINKFSGHKDSIFTLLAGQDGLLYSGSVDGTINIWNETSGELVHTLIGHTGAVLALALTRDGELISGAEDGSIHVWNLATGAVSQKIKLERLISDWERDDYFSGRQEKKSEQRTLIAQASGGRVITVSPQMQIQLWDAVRAENIPVQHEAGKEINNIYVDPDDNLWIGKDRKLEMRGLQSGKLLRDIPYLPGTVAAIAVSKDGKLFFGFTDIFKLGQLYDLNSGKLLKQILKNTEKGQTAFFMGDGLLVSVDSANAISILDLKTLQVTKKLDGHPKDIRAIIPVPGGQIVSCASDHTIKVWDPKSGECLKTLEGHSDTVEGIAIADDTILISASRDRFVKLWDLQTGQSRNLLRHDQPITGMVYSRETARLTLTDFTGRIWFYEFVRGANKSSGTAKLFDSLPLRPIKRPPAQSSSADENAPGSAAATTDRTEHKGSPDIWHAPLEAEQRPTPEPAQPEPPQKEDRTAPADTKKPGGTEKETKQDKSLGESLADKMPLTQLSWVSGGFLAVMILLDVIIIPAVYAMQSHSFIKFLLGVGIAFLVYVAFLVTSLLEIKKAQSLLITALSGAWAWLGTIIARQSGLYHLEWWMMFGGLLLGLGAHALIRGAVLMASMILASPLLSGRKRTKL